MKFKNYKLTKKYGGGGGTVSTIPEWAKPYLENVGKAGEAAYSSGDLSRVAGATGLQEKAFTKGAGAIESAATSGASALGSQQQRLAELASKGAYDTKALKDAALLEAGMKTAKLGQDYGAAGTLGSARQSVQQGAQNAATAAAMAKIDQEAAQKAFENKMLAERGIGENVGGQSKLVTDATSSIANLGNQQRQIEQQGLDSTWQGLQRYASTIYGNPARQQAMGGK